MPSIYLPQVIERSSRGERGYDIFSRLLLDRIIFLGTEIDDDVANLIIAQLLVLEADAPGKDIQLYINCPGGSVSAGLAIYDTMRYLESPVATMCMGMAASMGCFLLAAGQPGKRRSLPHARIMMHQPSQSGAVQGVAADIEIRAKEILYMRSKMFELLARHAGQPLERIERDFDRDRWMAAPDAQRYGLIDAVVETRAAAGDELARSVGASR